MALVVEKPPANAGDIRDVGSIPGLGRSPGGGHGNPLQYSCLENPMDRGPWWATVHGVTKSRTATEHFLLFVCVLRVVSNCDPMDCSPPGSSIHGILQARILEWVAISGWVIIGYYLVPYLIGN